MKRTSADGTVDETLEPGADAWVMKPATIEELEKVKETLIHRHVSIK